MKTAFLKSFAALAVLAGVSTARAGIVFTPHLSEYSKLPPGQYTEFTLIGTEIKKIYDRNGNAVETGTPFVPGGASTDAALVLLKYLWIGNIFRDTNIWYLKDHPQFCRAIGVMSYQQNTEQIANRGRLFGLQAGANGFGDLFGLCGIYTDEYRWGPFKANGLWATTVKFPIGRYETDAILNTGTNYWTYIPQFAVHGEAWGRLILDGTFAWQFNENNDQPSAGGLTPTRIADWRNIELNLAWKFNEHWFVDVGWGRRESVGPNYYDKLTVNFKDQPLSPQSACDNTNNGLGTRLISQDVCDNPGSDRFFLSPRPGPYADRGVSGTAITAGFYYIYRTSSVFNFRAFYPIAGRGSQIDALFNVCSDATVSSPEECNESNDLTAGSPAATRLFGVQEAAAVSASPFFEFRFVYLFWAP